MLYASPAGAARRAMRTYAVERKKRVRLCGQNHRKRRRRYVLERVGGLYGHDYRVGLVMAISYVKSKKQSIKNMANQIHDSAVALRFSNFRLWLQAYVTYLKGDRIRLTKDDVSLKVPGILGLHAPYVPFGYDGEA
jgi:hypothetical protein